MNPFKSVTAAVVIALSVLGGAFLVDRGGSFFQRIGVSILCFVVAYLILAAAVLLRRRLK